MKTLAPLFAALSLVAACGHATGLTDANPKMPVLYGPAGAGLSTGAETASAASTRPAVRRAAPSLQAIAMRPSLGREELSPPRAPEPRALRERDPSSSVRELPSTMRAERFTRPSSRGGF
jgi:hypothetical protein